MQPSRPRTWAGPLRRHPFLLRAEAQGNAPAQIWPPQQEAIRPPPPTLPATLGGGDGGDDGGGGGGGDDGDVQKLFIALPVPAHVQAAIFGRLDENAPAMRATLPARWQRGTNMHATVLFLGRCSRARVVAALARVPRRAGPLAVRLRGFAHRGDATLRVMLDVPHAGLERLSADIHAALDIDKTRPFSGHVTLARLAEGGGEGLGARCAREAGGAGALSDIKWSCDRFALFSSRPNSSLYVIEHETVLGDGKPDFPWLPRFFKDTGATRMGQRRWERQRAAAAAAAAASAGAAGASDEDVAAREEAPRGGGRAGGTSARLAEIEAMYEAFMQASPSPLDDVDMDEIQSQRPPTDFSWR